MLEAKNHVYFFLHHPLVLCGMAQIFCIVSITSCKCIDKTNSSLGNRSYFLFCLYYFNIESSYILYLQKGLHPMGLQIPQGLHFRTTFLPQLSGSQNRYGAPHNSISYMAVESFPYMCMCVIVRESQNSLLQECRFTLVSIS